MRRHADFNQVTRDALRHACGVALLFTEAALEQLMEAYRHLEVFADAEVAISALKGKTKLAILSNGAPDMLNAVVANSPLRMPLLRCSRSRCWRIQARSARIS